MGMRAQHQRRSFAAQSGKNLSLVGQTRAAGELCVNVPESKKIYYMQLDVGHYGVFNGSRFRQEIAPRMCDFHAMIERSDSAKPKLVKAG